MKVPLFFGLKIRKEHI